MSDNTVKRLLLVPNAETTIGGLSEEDRLLKLAGCPLCSITLDLLKESTDEKEEWKTCKEELGVDVQLIMRDELAGKLKDVVGDTIPSITAETESGEMHLLLDEDALSRCAGSVTDLRGRILYRASSAGLTMPAWEGDA